MFVNPLTAKHMAMSHKMTAFVLSLFLSLQVANSDVAAADEFISCLEDVAKADLAAKTAYQQGLRDLIVERRPDFSELADINRDIQVLFAEMRFARLDYLLANAPERLERAQGLSQFRNFDWTEEDVGKLTASTPAYQTQIARLEALKVQNQDHPDWPDMRAFVKGEMSEDGALVQLTATFVEHNAAMDAQLTDCKER